MGNTTPVTETEGAMPSCGGCDGCGGDCAAARCPFCAEPFRPGARPCAHLIAALDGAACVYTPFAIDTALHLSGDCAARVWSADALRETLGPAAGLLAAYPNGLGAPPDVPQLVDAVVARLSFPVERLERGTDRRYYAAKGVIARQQARHLVERLRLGLDRLQAIHTSDERAPDGKQQ